MTRDRLIRRLAGNCLEASPDPQTVRGRFTSMLSAPLIIVQLIVTSPYCRCPEEFLACRNEVDGPVNDANGDHEPSSGRLRSRRCLVRRQIRFRAYLLYSACTPLCLFYPVCSLFWPIRGLPSPLSPMITKTSGLHTATVGLVGVSPSLQVYDDTTFPDYMQAFSSLTGYARLRFMYCGGCFLNGPRGKLTRVIGYRVRIARSQGHPLPFLPTPNQ